MPRSQLPLAALLFFFTALGVLGGAAATTALTSVYGSNAAGDVNCSGGVDSVDALQILRHVAGMQVNLPPGCPLIGDGNEPTPTMPPATPTPQPTAPPGGPVAHCWMAVMGYAFVNPGILGDAAECNSPYSGSPSYECDVLLSINSVNCFASDANWPTYFCDYYSLINKANCFTHNSSFPWYDCGVEVSPATVNCQHKTYWVDGPDFECSLSANRVDCTSDSQFYPNFVCDRSGSSFTCH